MLNESINISKPEDDKINNISVEIDNEDKVINYVGFLKKHPHDNNSFIKISFKNLISKDEILIMIEDSVNNNILLLNSIKEYFTDN